MATPRSHIVDPDNPGVYHCISRCVRGAFLCQGSLSNRKARMHDRLIFLAGVFAVDVAGFAILDNHIHNVLCTHPERVEDWTDIEVVERWNAVFPKSIQKWALQAVRRDRNFAKYKDQIDQHGVLPVEIAIAVVAGMRSKVETLRERLSSLSWFMGCLKHHIAVEANREDECTGHFWEGRFRSIRILDIAALAQVMIYVDLNVIRALLARTPESSEHTSAQDRIHVCQFFEKLRGKRARAARRAPTLLRAGHDPDDPNADADSSCWLAPIRSLLEITVEQYLGLVDAAGRMLAPGKRGTIPDELAPILVRLGLISGDLAIAAAATQAPTHAPRGTVAGSPAACAAEAARRGVRFVLNALRGQ